MKLPKFLMMLLSAAALLSALSACKKSAPLEKPEGFVAAWNFADGLSSTCGKFTPTACGNVKTVNDGPLSGKSLELDGKSYLSIPYAQTGALNVKSGEVTVVAWVKWSGEGVGFVGGMWNEYKDGGKRQYGLFVSLPYYNGGDNVCGHISKTGKPTPPFPYSIDYSASGQKVPHGKWVCAAFTYDGKYIRSYLNGEFADRAPELIDHTKGFEGYPDGITHSKNPYYFPDGIGDNGSDFTIGSVLLKSGMGNFFKGRIGGLAVYNRALTDAELRGLVAAYPLE